MPAQQQRSDRHARSLAEEQDLVAVLEGAAGRPSVQIQQHVGGPHVAVFLARLDDAGPRNADAIDPGFGDRLDVLVRADPIDVIDGEAHLSKQLAHGVRHRGHAPAEELLHVAAPAVIDVEARPDFARTARARVTGTAGLDPDVAPVLSPGRQVGREHARALVHRPQGHGGGAVAAHGEHRRVAVVHGALQLAGGHHDDPRKLSRPEQRIGHHQRRHGSDARHVDADRGRPPRPDLVLGERDVAGVHLLGQQRAADQKVDVLRRPPGALDAL
jgi:hypothetical protein